MLELAAGHRGLRPLHRALGREPARGPGRGGGGGGPERRGQDHPDARHLRPDRAARGRLIFEGAALAGKPAHDIVAHGIAHVPEGRRLFPALTVAENLKMGAFLPAARAHFHESLERVYTLFPVLAERRAQRAGSLSGGEQQMLAVGRALMSRPKLILLDEPSMGLAPVMVLRLFDLIRRVREEGYTILVVEQNVRQVLKLVDRAYLLEVGRIKMEGRAAELAEQDFVRQAYVGC